MENENKNQSPQNGAAPSSTGSATPIAKPQDKNPEVKEGNPSEQRPVHGADAGTNTSSREGQLPSLDNGGNVDSDSDPGE